MWDFPLFDAQGSRRRFLAPRLERRLVREWEGARCQREVFVSGASVVGPAVITRAECRAPAAAAITLSALDDRTVRSASASRASAERPCRAAAGGP
jgi:hypothetical protein